MTWLLPQSLVHSFISSLCAGHTFSLRKRKLLTFSTLLIALYTLPTMPLPQSSRSVQPTPALIPRPPIVPPPMPPAPVTSNRRRYRCDSDDEDDEEEQELLHKKA